MKKIYSKSDLYGGTAILIASVSVSVIILITGINPWWLCHTSLFAFAGIGGIIIGLNGDEEEKRELQTTIQALKTEIEANEKINDRILDQFLDKLEK